MKRLLVALLVIAMIVPLVAINAFAAEGEPDYFYVKNIGDTTTMSWKAKNILYKCPTRDDEWHLLEGSLEIAKGETVYFKGSNNTLFGSRVVFPAESQVDLGGDITTLLNEKGNVATLQESAFESLFKYNAAIRNINNLKFPSTTINKRTYCQMFSNCSNLELLPAEGIKAKILGEMCCFAMFSNCTSIKSIPKEFLPSAKLERACYANMFDGCSSLSTLPLNLLRALELRDECYAFMFRDTGIKEIPPAFLRSQKLAKNCYMSMFSGCKNLTTIPQSLLPARTLAPYCYMQMFESCTGIQNLPQKLLPATTLATACYMQMFCGCTSLKSVPSGFLPAKELVTGCYNGMFDGCTSLTNPPTAGSMTTDSGITVAVAGAIAAIGIAAGVYCMKGQKKTNE